MSLTVTASDTATRSLFIDGSWVDSASPDTLQVINPATEEPIGNVPAGTRADAVAAIEAARRAFDHGPWPRMSVAQRREVLARMVEGMVRRRDELIELNILETGTTRPVAAVLQIDAAIAHFRDTVDRVMPTFAWESPSPAHVGMGIGQGIVVREPIGVASLITAYNFPLLLNVVKLAPALAAGCTAVLKPAPTTPLEGLVFGEIAEEAGLPAGVLNIVTGDREVSEELTVHPGVDMVSFTGSVAVGKAVYEQAARTLKRVVLELGGKSAHIITEDADLDAALTDMVTHTITHAGQGCAFLTRTLVHRSRVDEFVGLVTERFAQLTVGDPGADGIAMGPLISDLQRSKVESLIQQGVDEGARILIGGGRPAHCERGFYIEPTVFVDVDNSMTIAQTEFFGPVNVIIPFDTDEEAIRIANHSEYGLYGAVRAKDPARAVDIARQLRTGWVVVNGGGGAIPNTVLPYGGYKNSGIGREYGEAGLNEFLETKSIVWGVAAG